MFLPTALLTGCLGLHQLTVLPTVTLDKGNFKFLRYVEAEEESNYILGIGGMGAGQAEKNAYSKLVEKARLAKNQAIANVSYRRNNKLYFPFGIFYAKSTTVVSGWVVEFCDENGCFSQASDSLEVSDSLPVGLSDSIAVAQNVRYESEYFYWTTQNPDVQVNVFYDHGNTVIELSDESYLGAKLTVRTDDGDEYAAEASKNRTYRPGYGIVEEKGCEIILKNCDLAFPFSIIHHSDSNKTITNISAK